MAPHGDIISYAYTSAGRIPLSEVVIQVLQTDEETGVEDLLSVRITDRNGKTTAVAVETPPISDSLTPGNGKPFSTVTMTAEMPGYELIRVENVQIFPDVQTIQNFRMIPLTANPDIITQEELFIIPPQNL